MKNSIKLLSLSLISILSCKKDKNNENKTIISNEVKVLTTVDSNGVTKTDSITNYSKTIKGKTVKGGNKVEKIEYVYEAFDGTKANVTFTTGTKEGNFILIERNKLNIELPETQSNEKMKVFEKEGIKAVAEKNKLTITQSGKTFELERKK